MHQPFIFFRRQLLPKMFDFLSQLFSSFSQRFYFCVLGISRTNMKKIISNQSVIILRLFSRVGLHDQVYSAILKQTSPRLLCRILKLGSIYILNRCR